MACCGGVADTAGAAGPRLKPLLWGLLLALLLLRVGWQAFTPLQPAAGDPVLQLKTATGPLELTLRGFLLSDPVPSGGGGACRALMQLPVGRTELRFGDCP